VFLGALAGGLLAAPLAAEAQPAGRVWRIGMASLQPGQYPPEPFAILKEALQAKGYVEGRNIQLIVREGDGTRDTMLRLYRQLVAERVDILIAHANVNALAAKEITSSVPIVVLYATSPVEVGLVESLGRPGGNVTGCVWDQAPEHVSKLVEVLKEAAPSVTRVAILGEPQISGPASASYQEAVQSAARALHVSSKTFDLTRSEELDAVFKSMADGGMNGVIVLASNVAYRSRHKIVSLCARYRLPSAYNQWQIVEAGGLMSYGPDSNEQWRQAAVYIDRIVNGARPADLPMQQPTTTRLVINLKTAKALGLTIPQSLLQRADQVIE
jgi:putative ABC transport system substrate-binding protein